MNRKCFFAGVAAVVAAVFSWTGSASAADAVPQGISIDHRGLLVIGGGAVGSNLIAFGPGWKYAAQDYCLANIKKSGKDMDLKYEADFNVPGVKLKMVETTKAVNDKGRAGLKVTYTVSSQNAVSLDNMYVAFRMPVKEFAGSIITANGEKSTFPQAYEKEYLPFPKIASDISVANAKFKLNIKGADLQVSLVDARVQKNNENYELRVSFRNCRDFTGTDLSFDVFCEEIPFVITAGKDWVALPVERDVVPGSILDFSFLNDAPAGKYGRIIPGKDGHFEYAEKPGRPVKLVGANLCFSANYLPKEEADKLARRFQLLGYTTIRFHHTDVDLINGNWSAKKSDDISESQLDRLDYTFAAMKKAGLYVSIDLFTMRRFGADEIEGWNKYVDNPNVIKALVPILPGAFNAWTKMALKWLNHVNPYTGIAWKDDPALLSICPVNEDSIASVWSPNPEIKKLYADRFEKWLQEKGKSDVTADVRNPLFAQFLTEIKMESNRQMEKFFKDNGVKAMITGSNWWDTMAQAFKRSQFDVVDNHQYWDHPNQHWLPSGYNQRSDMKESMSYILPCLMMPTRIFNKPFTVTEYNFCAPNQFRAEAGAMMGAYSALQDWDGLYRFAWSHDAKNIASQDAVKGFDIGTDPLSQLTERQILLLFGRGDVSPAKKKYVYAVTMKEATREGVGDMWAKGLFPRPFTVTGLVSQVGSQVVDNGGRIQGRFDGVVAMEAPADEALSGNQFIEVKKLAAVPVSGEETVSDTGEITLNNKKGYVKVVSDRTECIVAHAKTDLNGKNLSVGNSDVFYSISASAMDASPLSDSKRILLFHLTNVLNTNMGFSNEKMQKLLKYGELPYLVHVGSADVTLKNSNPDLKLYAVDFSGRRLREVKTEYKDGAYQFKVEITGNPDTPPAMIYELNSK
ncbi:MAG TPA: hypothetical protein DET40_03925 [Lentisphaeria bacterium]|nr:MAG: hypothetical protein A2X45_15280 [Lentisphaerae bacterium GWF2_50_93]HCE42674.1 hypothetical protein [Lentisphaeria bacterium]